MRPAVCVTDESTVLDTDEVQGCVRALQKQVNHDWQPEWGSGAKLYVSDSPLAPDHWQLVLLDTAESAGYLGYHDLTEDGAPLGKVFAATDEKYGYSWSVTASHELLEMLGDPWVNLTAIDPHTMRAYAYESCDAVEADELGYEVDGFLLSDFQLPAYFDPTARGSNREVDFRGALSPGDTFKLAPGGYMSYLDLKDLSSGWQEVYARKAEAEVDRDVEYESQGRKAIRRRAMKGELRRSERRQR